MHGRNEHRKVKKTEIQAQEILNTPWAGPTRCVLQARRPMVLEQGHG